jgi:ribonucleoside-diphosphate reductase alpha chain
MAEPVRKRLPNRREHETLEFDHAGFHYTAGIGRFRNGGLAEIFLNCAKSGTTIESHARDAAIVASIALQHGATAETIRHAITRNRDGTASGALGTLLDILAIEDVP